MQIDLIIVVCAEIRDERCLELFFFLFSGFSVAVLVFCSSTFWLLFQLLPSPVSSPLSPYSHLSFFSSSLFILNPPSPPFHSLSPLFLSQLHLSFPGNFWSSFLSHPLTLSPCFLLSLFCFLLKRREKIAKEDIICTALLFIFCLL